MKNGSAANSDSPPQTQPRAPRRRRLWPFIILLVLVLLVISYALLPWLIPTNWLKDQIVARIKDQFGRSASIAAMEISWADGIIVRGITIDRLEEFGPGPFFQAAQLQMEFRPLSMILKQGLGTVRVDQPRLWIVTDQAGRTNLTFLPKPAQPSGFDLIEITNADLHFLDNLHARQGLLSIPIFRIARNSQTGQYNLLAQGRTSPTTGVPIFSMEVSYSPEPYTTAPAARLLRGSAKLDWNDLDLSLLPLPRVGTTDCQVINGSSSGSADLELYSDGHFELLNCAAGSHDLNIQLTEVAPTSESPVPSVQPAALKIPRAAVVFRGSYEFVSGDINISTVDCSAEGLEFHGSLQGRITHEPRVFLPSIVSLAAVIQPDRLREQIPVLDQLLHQHDLTATGSTSLHLDFNRSEKSDNLTFDLNADKAGLHAPDLLHKSTGTPCSLTFAAEVDRSTGRLTLTEPLICRLASARLSLQLHLPQSLLPNSLSNPVELPQLTTLDLADAAIDASLQIDRPEELPSILPQLTSLFSQTKLSGPIRVDLAIEPIPPVAAPSAPSPDQPSAELRATAGSELQFSLALPAQTTLQLDPHFRKPPDTPLILTFAGRLAPHNNRLENVNSSFRLGEMTLSLSDAFVELPASTDGLAATSVAGNFQWANSQVFTQAFNTGTLGEFSVAGDLNGRFSFAFAPDHPLDIALEIDATDFGCEIIAPDSPDHVTIPAALRHVRKSRGTPAKMDLQIQADLPFSDVSPPTPEYFRSLFDPEESAFAFRSALNWTLAESTGSLRLSRGHLALAAPAADPAEAVMDTQRNILFELNIPRLSLQSIADHLPALQQTSRDYQVGGSALVELSGLLGSDLIPNACNLKIDLTDAAWQLQSSSAQSIAQPPAVIMHKSVGLPATLAARFHTEASSGPNSRAAHIDSLDVNLAGSTLKINASALLSLPDQRPLEKLGSANGNFLESLLDSNPLIWAKLSGQGSLLCNDRLLELFPSLAELADRENLRGDLHFTFDSSANTTQASSHIVFNAGPDGLHLGNMEFQNAEYQLQLFLDTGAEDFTVSYASIQIPQIRLKALDKPIQFSADIALQNNRADIRQIYVSAGDSALYCTGALENVTTVPTGRLYIYTPLLDQPALIDLFTAAGLLPQPETADSSEPSLSDESLPEDQPGAAAEEQASSEQSPQESPSPEPFSLPPMDINLKVLADRFIFKDPFGTQHLDFHHVDFDIQLASSAVMSQFTAAWNGGRLEGALNVLFDQPGMPLVYEYDALGLIADENTAPMISRVFPDMTVNGTITESRRIVAKLRPTPGKQEFIQESGHTTLTDGKLSGPAAPAWVTRWFPNLSLTEYPFQVSHNVFERSTEDGSMANDMVFVGKDTYNTYVSGITAADNTTDYALGVDYSSASLEDRHRWRGLRVWLLTYTGQIEEGRWASQTVNFVWPTRTAWEMLMTGGETKTIIKQSRQNE